MKQRTRRQFTAGMLATVFAPSVVQAAAFRKARINVADFGALPDSLQDASPGLKAAIAACSDNGAILEFPHGRYQFTDSGDKILDLSGRTDFEIIGNSSTLVFSGTGSPISMTRMSSVSVHDLVLDWKRPPFSQGKMTDLSPDGKQMDVVIDSAFPISGNEPIYSIRFYDAGDRALRIPRNANDSSARPSSIAAIGQQRLRLTFDRELSVRNDTTVVLLHTREGYAMMLNEIDEIELKNILVHSAPGMVFAGTRVRDLTIRGCRITPGEGTPLVSSTADGVHFWSSRGRFLVEQCMFQGLCDDCINIHSFFMRALPGNDQRQIMLTKSNTINGSEIRLSEPMIPMRGDHIQILDRKTLVLVGAATVESVNKSDNNVVLNLDRAVALSNSEDLFVSDPDQVPKLNVIGCRFENSSGCGVVTHADSVIQNNTFSALGWAGVNCLIHPNWLEGPLVSNVTIRENIFRGCGRVNRGSLLVHALRRAADGGLVDVTTPINKNVRVESNYFEDPLGTPITIVATDGIILSDNHFSSDRSSTDPLKPKLAVQFLRIRDGIISNNTCRGLDGVAVTASDKSTLQFNNHADTGALDSKNARPYCTLVDGI
jgi:Right handed beta helix region